MLPHHDLVVVGGGIAGGAFASAMARGGADVLVLERQVTYRDRVRGELLWPWGVRELQRLGLDDVLLTAGANVADRMQSHDELEGRDAPRASEDLSQIVDGVPGSLNLYHPDATRALVDAARDCGARVSTGVDHVVTEVGAEPTVSWSDGDGAHRVRCDLIVGADGRSSSVRRQAGIDLRGDQPAHLAAGLLVDDVAAEPSTNVAARAGDALFLSFPQRNGRARLYYCIPTSQRNRFSGRDAGREFLRATRDISCLPEPERWANATPAGPCATFTCEDTWVETPHRGHVVLIGDAAGYNNPLIGQGLALAFRDARVLSEQLLAYGGAAPEALDTYARERAERLRRARISCLLVVWIHGGFEQQDPASRRRLDERASGDDVLGPLMGTTWRGFDDLERTPSDSEVRDRLFGKA